MINNASKDPVIDEVEFYIPVFYDENNNHNKIFIQYYDDVYFYQSIDNIEKQIEYISDVYSYIEDNRIKTFMNANLSENEKKEIEDLIKKTIILNETENMFLKKRNNT